MMNLRHLLSHNSDHASDTMMMSTSISRSKPMLSKTQAQPRGRVAKTAIACLALLACLFANARLRAQAAATPVPVLVADFNHDGIPDVLVESSTTPTATIAFGSVPYGTFSGSAKAVTFPAACTSFSTNSLLVGDFNGDNLPDIAYFCGASVGVLLGNGDGTFAVSKGLAGAIAGTAVAADFNKDGKLDLVILGSTAGEGATTVGTLQYYAGNGDGTFAAGVSSSLDQSTYSAPLAVDLNGDGSPDIALLNVIADNPSSVAIFSNNLDGTFGVAAAGVASANTVATVEAGANTILAGHFFTPTSIDLVVSGSGANGGFSVLKNTSTGTTYSFADPVTIPYAGLGAAKVGNFTGSGYTDLVASNGTSIAVLANDGTGNFAANYATLAVVSASALFAVADVNGDGYSDIYTAAMPAGGALQLAVNVTSGSATATSQPFPLPSVGTKAVSASWPGNVNLLASTATGQQIVTGATSLATLASSKNPSNVGDSVTFTVVVAPSLVGTAVPTGTVVLTDGAATLATGTLDGTGSFAYTTATLTQATHLIRATYAGDNNFAGSTSAVLSQVVNHAPAVASNLNWATPAAIGYGTALTGAQLDAAALDANGVTIPGTFAYTPAAGTVLAAGARTLSVTFTPTDLLSFLPATKTVVLTVAQAVPVLTWATPANVAYGTPLSATQLNAVAVGLNATALPGTFTYNPAAGTVLAPGTQTLGVTFVPTDAVDYTNATGTVKLIVSGVVVSSFTPNTANLGDPATKITLVGVGFVATSVVQVNGTAIPTTLVNATTLTAIVPASYFTAPGTLQITVADPGVSSVSPALLLTVNAPAIAATVSAPPTAAPGTQPSITVTLSQPYPVDLVGTLTIAFTRSGTPQLVDPSLQFAAGGLTFSFPIPANTTTVPVIQLQAGTIAGTITVPLTLTAGGVNVTPANLLPVTIVVPTAIPTVSSMTVTRSGNQLTVVMHGFSNTREVVSAQFHFTAAPGATLGTQDLTLPADAIFNTDWYETDASDAYGSTFTYTQIFNTSDTAANVGSVDATLTNTVGASTTMTAQ